MYKRRGIRGGIGEEKGRSRRNRSGREGTEEEEKGERRKVKGTGVRRG